jgi:hypothetical protein
MPLKIFIACLILGSTALHAAPRSWKSSDGRSVDGEFVKRDTTSVTVRRADKSEVTIQLDQLDANDRTWLNVNHPLPGQEAPPQAAVFDELCFGDDREQVLKKLKASKFVEMTTDETFIGRTGLNGIFRTRKKVGGMDVSLYFDWTDDNKLKEITLQTDTLNASDIDAKLVPCWKQFIMLLTTLLGKPLHGDDELHTSSIHEGSFSPTHLWKLETPGSAALGLAKERGKYQVVVRYTQKEIKPVSLP